MIQSFFTNTSSLTSPTIFSSPFYFHRLLLFVFFFFLLHFFFFASYLFSNSPSPLSYLSGTKENEECSGRGLCDRLTGVCNCFSGKTDRRTDTRISIRTNVHTCIHTYIFFNHLNFKYFFPFHWIFLPSVPSLSM